MSTRPRRQARAALALAALAALGACGRPPAPRGRYTLVSVDGHPVPIGASFYTPAVGFRSDLVGGDLLVCDATTLVWTDRVRELNNVVPTDDPRAHPRESWITEAMRLRQDGSRLLLALAPGADRPARTDTGAISGPRGDTITVDQHTGLPGARPRRYLFARAPGDTAPQGNAGTLCGNYMVDPPASPASPR